MDKAFFINTGPQRAAWSMALDEVLLEKVKKNPDTAFFKVYQWDPAAVSIGYSQRMRQEVDRELCARRGYDVVRRPTGGRVVLHKNELAYTYASKSGGFDARHDLSRLVGSVFTTALAAMGVTADLVQTGAAPPPFRKNLPSLCFTHASEYEVMAEGRKLMGRATREKGNVRLEQGFILLYDDYLEMPELLPGMDEKEKAAVKQKAAEKTICLKSLGKDADPDRLAEQLYTAAQKVIGVPWAGYDLSAEDRSAAENLVEHKHTNEDWLAKF